MIEPIEEEPMRLFTLAILILCIIALSFRAPHAAAQAGGAYDLTWNTFDSGGATDRLHQSNQLEEYL